MTEEFNYCHVVGQTDVGRKRAANEDSMGNAVTRNGLVSVVCDGMGGHVGGATASRIAVSTILDNLNTKYYDDPRIAIGESIDLANMAILKEAEAHPELTGMGSTCVLVIVRDGKVYYGHVGDSRIYLIRSKRILQLTKDHSYVQMLVDRGELTKEQAEHHPRKNEITNALGIPNMSPATVADDAVNPEAGDCFLLCSDGLSGMVPDPVINKVVSRQTEMNAQERVDRLVFLANENGGLDNITAQMVEFSVTPGAVAPSKQKMGWPLYVVAGVLVVCLGIGAWYVVKSHKVKDPAKAEDVLSSAPMDTIPVNLGQFQYKKNSELITIVFSDNSVNFSQGDKSVYSESNVSLIPSSLKMENPCIDLVLKKEGTYVLKYTETKPVQTVEVFVCTKDTTKLYRFAMDVITESSPLQLPSGRVSPVTPRSDDSAVQTPVCEAKVLDMDLGQQTVAKGTKLIFSYSAKPMFKIGGNDHVINDYSFDEVDSQYVVYDTRKWDMKPVPKNKQVIFTFKEESAEGDFVIEIPCVVKNAETVVLVKVHFSVAAPAPVSKDVAPAEGDDTKKDEAPADTTATDSPNPTYRT